MSEDNKTEQPTDKKLRDAHKEGESAKSPDATATSVLFFCSLMLWLGPEFIGERLRRLFSIAWQFIPERNADISIPIAAVFGELMFLTLPFAIVAMVGACIGMIAQGAMTMSMKPVMLKFEKLNPVAGFKRLFALRNAIDSGMLLLKAILLTTLLWQTVESLLPLLVDATRRPPETLLSPLWSAVLRVLFIAIAGFAVFGLADLGIQRFLFRRDHRMSKDEITREQKSEYGNPEVKGKRKELAYELLFGDPRSAVATSSVVIANPTHYAVAIFHEPGELPTIAAKGVDDVALQLRGHAETCGVPVVVNPPLAQTLYRVPVGAGIPRECFEMVGLLLHTVSRLRNVSGAPPTAGARS